MVDAVLYIVVCEPNGARELIRRRKKLLNTAEIFLVVVIWRAERARASRDQKWGGGVLGDLICNVGARRASADDEDFLLQYQQISM